MRARCADQRGRWGVNFGAAEFHTDGYVLVDPSARGRVDMPAGSRRATLGLIVERKLGATAHAFLCGALYGDARTNGTPLQTNRTHIRQLSAGGDWPATTFGAFRFRAYAGAQVCAYNSAHIDLLKRTG